MRRIVALGLAVSLVLPLLLPGVGSAEDVSIEEHLKRFLRDGAYLAASPLRLELKDLLPLAAVGGAIGATIAYDGELRDRLVGLRHWNGAGDLTTAGDVLQFGGLIGGAGLYAYGRLADDERAIDQAWLQADGLLWSVLLSEALKYTIGRDRPDSGHPHSFHPFSGNDSFPSGHTLPAFTAATLAVEEYPSLATAIPLFTLATAVGVSRLAADKHWTSDVLASAALGVGIGHVLYRVHTRPFEDWNMELGGGMVHVIRHW